MGDATNEVLILAGELLKVAENLLIMGLHPSEVTIGYNLASKKALEELESVFDIILLQIVKRSCGSQSSQHQVLHPR